MFTKAVTTSLSTVARCRVTNAMAQNGSKANVPFRALSDVSASAPKQPVNIPPPVAKQREHGKAHRQCHSHRRGGAGKMLGLMMVGYGGYWYGSNYGKSAEHKSCPWNDEPKKANSSSETKVISKPENAEG